MLCVQLQYTVSVAGQKANISGDEMRAGNSFEAVKTHTETLKHAETSQVKYDLVGKIAEGTVLTRRTAASILKGIYPDKFSMFRNNPEELGNVNTQLPHSRIVPNVFQNPQLVKYGTPVPFM